MFKTVFYTVHSRKLPAEFDNYRITHLSDLHGAVYGQNHRKLIQKIRQTNPNLVVMTGDMADYSFGSIPHLLDLCRQICRYYPVYCVLGNHEQEMSKKKLDPLLTGLKSLGVVVLENQSCILSHHGASVKLYGLQLPMVYYKDPLKEYKKDMELSVSDVRKRLGPLDDTGYSILLAHNPLYYPAYRDWGADLTLSGHVHGGIIRIPGKGGLLSPDVTFFPKYDGGHFRENGKDLIVSRGLGNHFLVRVMNPPELLVVTLHRSLAISTKLKNSFL